MKTLLLDDGDLVLGSGSFETVTGPTKLRQDLSYAMREPIGTDRFHPGWGSILPSLVGEPITDTLLTRVEGEVRRVLDNYVVVQRDRMSRDRRSGQPSRFTSGEVIDTVKAVSVRPDWDRVHVRADIRTLTADEVVVFTVRG